LQFRLLEVRLGLKRNQRLKYTRKEFVEHLPADHRLIVERYEQTPSMYELVNDWLVRMPFLKMDGFDFWETYKACVRKMMAEDRAEIEADERLSANEKTLRLEMVESSSQEFEISFDEAKYSEMRAKGLKTLDYLALQSAIMIHLYQEEPIFQLPHQLLNLLLDIDEQLCRWRHGHALMVHRMLGLKMGTGGSSGFHYLKATANQHKIFSDLFNLSMFLLPRSSIPPLPQDIAARLRFNYHNEHRWLCAGPFSDIEVEGEPQTF
jgi:tryptophan 2,3-dioxygenase